MLKLFEENASDSDVEIKTNNEYATKYNNWREKEELNKLKNKYGDKINLNEADGSSSSSEDDEEGKYLTEEIEKDFFKTLAYLKRKDPKIYNEEITFFKDKPDENKNSTNKKSKSKKTEPIFMKDYERKMILEKGAKFEDSDEEDPQENCRSSSPTYVEEQRRIKESLKKVVDDDDENDDKKWGGLFQKRKKTKEEEEQDEEDYRQWLKGKKEHLENEEIETDLKSLKEYWNKPNLDKAEVFLKDYLLNKRYLEKEDENHIPTYEEIVHDSDEGLSEDEKNLEKQEEFEIKYNFRFEDPDQEFIKRYPRTMEHSVRKTDDRRKLKRVEIKQRKEEEKKKKQEELNQLKILKRKEIEEKIAKIKEITGNNKMAFNDMDIDGDFDPEEHDKRMHELFDNEYYQTDEGDQKPEFPNLEEELGPWKDQNELHCEDEDFNMDCDYDPSRAKKEKNKNKRKKRNRSDKSKDKDEIDENDEQYNKYTDELYEMDCEDIIGDIPCRFKYREVLANDFGLSVEEILLAKDKELNRWCSLKKTTQYRPEQIERYDVIAYKKKATNENLKRKYLPSLFEELEDELTENNKIEQDSTEMTFEYEKNNENDENITTEAENVQSNKIETNRKKKNKKKKNKTYLNKEIEDEKFNTAPSEEISNEATKKKKEKKKKNKLITNEEQIIEDMGNISKSSDISQLNKISEPKWKKQEISNLQENTTDNYNSTKEVTNLIEPTKLSAGKNKNKKQTLLKVENQKRKLSVQNENNDNPNKKRKLNNKKKFKKNKSEQTTNISDLRLKAYGINPKKFKNKLKYKNKQSK